jgi:hypothetical protein
MAHDLLLGQIPVDVSRHPAPGSPTVNAPTAALIGVGAASLLVAVARALGGSKAPPAKNPALEHYAEYYHPNLHRTQEVPVIPMRELMLDGEE